MLERDEAYPHAWLATAGPAFGSPCVAQKPRHPPPAAMGFLSLAVRFRNSL